MLFVGDDWAEDHHDVEVMDASGRRLAKARLPEGMAGMTRLHAMIGQCLGDDADEVEDVAARVKIGIETDRGPWVRALVAAGYTVYPVNPLQAARYRERLALSGAKSDAADAHMLADMVRTDSHQLRPIAGDSAEAEAVKVVTRMHKTLIWERTRAVQRLRHALREYFPAALVAFEDLDAADTLELLAKAPDPAAAARLSINQISAALKRARRRDIASKAAAIQAALRAEHLGQPAVVTAAYAASVRALVALLVTLNEQVKALQGQVEAHFGQHPDAEIILSQPGLGVVLGARVLAEFGDDHARYTSAKARKNYAATSPITRASGKKRTVAARFVHNDRLIDALMTQAFTSLRLSPGARAYYDRQRARGASYNAAPTGQPPRRHPPRMPQNRHPLRRGDRLVASPQRGRCLTFKLLGCLSGSRQRSMDRCHRLGRTSRGITAAGKDKWRRRLAKPMPTEVLEEGRRLREQARGHAA